MGKDDLWQKFVYPPSTRQGCTQEGGHTLRLNTERGRTCFAASDLTLAERRDFWQLSPSAGGVFSQATLLSLSSAKAPIVLVIDLDHLLVLFLILISSTSSSWSQLIKGYRPELREDQQGRHSEPKGIRPELREDQQDSTLWNPRAFDLNSGKTSKKVHRETQGLLTRAQESPSRDKVASKSSLTALLTLLSKSSILHPPSSIVVIDHF